MSQAATLSTRKYEAVIIMHPDCSETEQKALFQKNKEILKTFEGDLNHIDTWGRRKLANPINKLTRGIYFHATFEAKGDAIAELERTMRINDKVLRFQHSRLDDRMSLAKYLENFKDSLAETSRREKEREVKAQQRKAAMSARRAPRD